jgi:hypothetical protein
MHLLDYFLHFKAHQLDLIDKQDQVFCKIFALLVTIFGLFISDVPRIHLFSSNTFAHFLINQINLNSSS